MTDRLIVAVFGCGGIMFVVLPTYLICKFRESRIHNR